MSPRYGKFAFKSTHNTLSLMSLPFPLTSQKKHKVLSIIYKLIPPASYVIWWFAALLIFLWFDVLWCRDSDFSPFLRYRSLYFILPAAATLFTLPSALSRRRAWQFILLIVLAILLEANIIYFRTYYTHIPLTSYALVSNLNGFENSVLEGLRPADIGFVVILTSACLCQHLLVRSSSRYNPLAYSIVLAFLIGVNYIFFAARGGFRTRMANLSTDVTAMTVQPPVYTIFLPLLYEAMTNGAKPSPESIAQAVAWFENHDASTSLYCPSDSMTKSNLVLILCESLESWPIGLEIEGREVTPFLNSLVGDTSHVYYNSKVLTQARAGRSIDGQLLYVAGRYPLRNGVFVKDHARATYYSLPRAMKERGASTYLVNCDSPSTWNQAVFATSLGIDTLLMHDTWFMSEDMDWHDGVDILDHRLLGRCVDRMRQGKLWRQGENAFLLVVTHSGHNPFTLPDGLSPLKLQGDYPKWLCDYLEVTAYVDAVLADFVTYVMSRPDADNTVIAIVGDHEGLGAHRREIAADSRFDFVDQENHTPFILINSPYAGRGNYEINQVDVYSGLLDAIGLYHSYRWRGMGWSPFDPSYEGTDPAVASDALTAGDLWFDCPDIR